ncbi:GAF domain-containing sensor histidine kinase [Kordiimonas lacus]|uniref:GAF domain-containing sensor histidine kinase n=1 Tax=Kordiimonas lacus TaxID=637679 RepID=UPI000836567F|nr:HAMP domain-containing sensor histidine kinase [Kordiimonas lacus]
MTDKANKSTPPQGQSVLDKIASLVGKAYFNALTKLLCEDMGADIAYVGLLSDDREEMKTISLYWDGAHMDFQSWPINDTPCLETVNKDFCLHEATVQTRYPKDSFLKKEQIEAYVGFPLFDDQGTAIGAVVAESRMKLEDSQLFDCLRAAQCRTQVELQHHKALDTMRETLSQSLLLNYSKSMFMANITHELRTPLSAIIGYASLIRDRQIEGPQVQEYAAEICASGEGLLTLISDIMSLAMLEISDETAKSEKFDLTDLARTGNRMIQHQAAQKHLKILAATRTEPLYVKGDAGHTKKALMNMLTNAVKYTSIGHVAIEVTKREDGSAVLSVIDTGIGMTDDILTKACEPLTNFKNAYDMHQEGSGLGIPTTMVLMDRQKARLEVESEVGKGTKAHLVFPPDLVIDDDDGFI